MFISEVQLKDKAWYQQLLKNSPPGCIFLSAESEFQEILDLFSLHPERAEKAPGAITYFKVRLVLPWKTKCFYVGGDNFEVDFSIGSCLGESKADALTQAMRRSITSQIFDAKDSLERSCQKCWKLDYLEVDHVIPFKDLKTKFLKQIEAAGLKMPVEFDGETGYRFKKEDAEFERAWLQFHWERAIFQMLCGKCNKQRNRVVSI